MNSESCSTASGDTSSRPSDDSETDSPSTPPSFTHNHVIADCHLKNFNHVLNAFKSTDPWHQAAERLSTCHPSGHKYASLHALLLSWQEDDLGVDEEVDKLGFVLLDQYEFDVQYWKIPVKRSTFELTQRVLNWTAEYEGEDELLLVYYAGHGWMDSSRQAIWSK
ncbi:hypothetical protein G7054_g6701 [Neopestalotiopsis clavispora]|nr:hypothetical protein G7054_g6701 [Neopestalotiopsis clavispora]